MLSANSLLFKAIHPPSPISIFIIEFAQITNGFLLPIISALLLWLVNKSKILGKFKNNNLQNSIGFAIVLLATFLSLRTIFLAFQ